MKEWEGRDLFPAVRRGLSVIEGQMAALRAENAALKAEIARWRAEHALLERSCLAALQQQMDVAEAATAALAAAGVGLTDGTEGEAAEDAAESALQADAGEAGGSGDWHVEFEAAGESEPAAGSSLDAFTRASDAQSLHAFASAATARVSVDPATGEAMRVEMPDGNGLSSDTDSEAGAVAERAVPGAPHADVRSLVEAGSAGLDAAAQ
jgi:hypothetical protein